MTPNNLDTLLEAEVKNFEKRFGGFIATEGKRKKQDEDNEWFKVKLTQAYTLGKEEGERLQKMSNDINNSSVY